MPYATELLAASERFLSDIATATGIKYFEDFTEPHSFVLIYENGKELSGQIPRLMQDFNRTAFGGQEFNLINLVFDQENALVLIKGLQSKEMAEQYVKAFNSDQSPLKPYEGFKSNHFVITDSNFDIFYDSKNLDSYINFFRKHYTIPNEEGEE